MDAKVWNEILRGASVAGSNHLDITDAESSMIFCTACDPSKPQTPTAVCNAVRLGYHLGLSRAAGTHAEAPMNHSQRELFNEIAKLNDTECRRALKILRAVSE